jgi:SAM-dependent methyltransferase
MSRLTAANGPTAATGDATARTRWGSRAASLYTEEYARRYRQHDEAFAAERTIASLAAWLQGIVSRFEAPIDVLDLGCGTGRYFHALSGAHRIVGIDVSRAMLEQAREPFGCAQSPDRLTLVEGDFLDHDFAPGEFDLVYAIGVLAEHSPLDEQLARRVARWLKPGGRFAFTTVDPSSSSVPRSRARAAAERLLESGLPLPGFARRAVRNRLMSGGLYADAERVREILAAAALDAESIEPFASDVHQHVLVVARKGQP